jgi:small Trp-rich protein
MGRVIGFYPAPLSGYETLQIFARFIGALPEGVMYLLILGLGLLLMKYLQIGFVADLSWWWVLSPFALAVAWWAWADATGYTKRRAMDKMTQKKQDRIDRQREAMGIKTKRR